MKTVKLFWLKGVPLFFSLNKTQRKADKSKWEAYNIKNFNSQMNKKRVEKIKNRKKRVHDCVKTNLCKNKASLPSVSWTDSCCHTYVIHVIHKSSLVRLKSLYGTRHTLLVFMVFYICSSTPWNVLNDREGARTFLIFPSWISSVG